MLRDVEAYAANPRPRLDLSKKCLKAFKGSSSLEQASIGRFGTLPDELWQLSTLQELNLSHKCALLQARAPAAAQPVRATHVSPPLL